MTERDRKIDRETETCKGREGGGRQWREERRGEATRRGELVRAGMGAAKTN